MTAKMLQKSDLEAVCAAFVEHSAANFVHEEQAIRKDIVGMRIYDLPILGVASADDPIFESFRQTGVIGPHFNPPKFWLPEAVSVLSFFLPFTERVGRPILKTPHAPTRNGPTPGGKGRAWSTPCVGTWKKRCVKPDT